MTTDFPGFAENTMLGRCTVAFQEAVDSIDYPLHTTRTQRAGVAAVLEHLAAEMVWLNQQQPSLTVHELARILTLEAAGELAGWADDADGDEEPEDDWDSHPSLTASERNPSLR